MNTLWGFANLVIALAIAGHWSVSGTLPDVVAALVGAVGTGLYLASHFGKVQRDKQVG
ncbi:hypothetical protein [Paraburkholderia solisilvae]|uniref:hypothetical protein n=1 Tax=Paraburkholderia solisilvae TaxID=624376 RepID=UPI0031B581B1